MVLLPKENAGAVAGSAILRLGVEEPNILEEYPVPSLLVVVGNALNAVSPASGVIDWLPNGAGEALLGVTNRFPFGTVVLALVSLREVTDTADTLAPVYIERDFIGKRSFQS